MRFNPHMFLDHLTNLLDFFFRNEGRLTPCLDKSVNTRRDEYVEAPIEPAVQENIAGEEWQEKPLAAVFPSVIHLVKGEEDLESLIGKDLGDDFLVLMSRV
jgi:hypothetical protein